MTSATSPMPTAPRSWIGSGISVTKRAWDDGQRIGRRGERHGKHDPGRCQEQPRRVAPAAPGHHACDGRRDEEPAKDNADDDPNDQVAGTRLRAADVPIARERRRTGARRSPRRRQSPPRFWARLAATVARGIDEGERPVGSRLAFGWTRGHLSQTSRPRCRGRSLAPRLATARSRAAFSSSVAPGRASGSVCSMRRTGRPSSRRLATLRRARPRRPRMSRCGRSISVRARYLPSSCRRLSSPAVSETNSCGPPLPSSGIGSTRHCGPSVTPRAASAARAMSAAAVRLSANMSIRSRPATPQTHAGEAHARRWPATRLCVRGLETGLNDRRRCRFWFRSGRGRPCCVAIARRAARSTRRIASRRHRTTHSGTNVITTTISFWNQMPGASDRKMGSANQTTSNAKCSTIPGRGRNRRRAGRTRSME